ncbi:MULTISPECIES: VanZ family protein [Nocardiopsis]|uniref:VanZ family protein n=1 Tax=Nocardiopsis TaxID=2013 RepID=UPI0009890CB9|nr:MULTISPECIES: VanZ family protein [Nocardiopsis]
MRTTCRRRTLGEPLPSFLLIAQQTTILIALPVVVLAVLAASVLRARRTASSYRPYFLRYAGWTLLVLGALLTVLYTLRPVAGADVPDRYIDLTPVSDLATQFENARTSGAARFQLVGNLLLLSWLSLGTILTRPMTSVPKITALAAGASLLIECLQYALNNGRITSLSDFVLNTAGAAVVAWAGTRLRPRLERWSTNHTGRRHARTGP